MKNFCITIVFFLCLPVFAGWTYSDTDKSSNNKYYYDFETLRKDGNLRWIVSLVNIGLVGKNGWSSLVFRDEIDCEKKTYRTVSSVVFSDKFGEGKVLMKFDDPDKSNPTVEVVPNTVGWTGLHEVCKR